MGAQEVVSRALQGEARAGGDYRGCIRTALGRSYAHSTGARAYRALRTVMVEIVDAIEGVSEGPCGPVEDRVDVEGEGEGESEGEGRV